MDQQAANGIKKKKRHRRKKKAKGDEEGAGRAGADGDWDGDEQWAQRLATCIKDGEDIPEGDVLGGGHHEGRDGQQRRERRQDLADLEEEEIEREVQEFRQKMETIFGIKLEPTTTIPDEA